MKKKKLVKICFIIAPIIMLLLNFYISLSSIPNTIFVRENEDIELNSWFTISNSKTSYAPSSKIDYNKDNIVEIKLLGLLPVKSATIKSIPDLELYPGGTSIGIKLNTKGVLVVAFSDIETPSGKLPSPCSQNGINIGDSIIKINNMEIKSAEQLVNIVDNSQGEIVKLTIERKDTIVKKEIKPIKCSSDDKYKIGLWVRDSTAGVGTLTFYDDNSKRFGALGHPITDVDTGTVLSVNNGQIVKSSIINVRRGVKGTPGELKGIFIEEENALGSIKVNTECGVFGEAKEKIINPCYSKPLKIALRNEIKEGPAKIITTIDEEGPKAYDIIIEKLLVQDSPGPKSMVIKVTDPELLKKTGGIVQGMSGSPIIQNNKIVGAVTHVLINKPDTGYGIYIEWMIKDADILSK